MGKVHNDTLEASKRLMCGRVLKVLFAGVAVAIGGAYVSM